MAVNSCLLRTLTMNLRLQSLLKISNADGNSSFIRLKFSLQSFFVKVKCMVCIQIRRECTSKTPVTGAATKVANHR